MAIGDMTLKGELPCVGTLLASNCGGEVPKHPVGSVMTGQLAFLGSSLDLSVNKTKHHDTHSSLLLQFSYFGSNLCCSNEKCYWSGLVTKHITE